ncbi:hypothetical protein AS026_35725 [Rhizobium altiplani]|uniref:ORC1/DEAH AAA+ ATPase domain-containing protein n=1 Tax=Rhizobium altiplani TaxID=1864509 RepID=A0A109JVT4_9HYPH|nr:AAA family ATPase [Rhizobium altiplani]KWV56021.1 hypothetical protein AS026_35725 [Rhizobium altiplani]
MQSDVVEFLKAYRDLYNFSGPGQRAMAPPMFHLDAVEQVVSEARENAARPTGPMQHMVIVGRPGSGKTFLTHAFASLLGTTTFPGKVVRLPQFQPHIQSPEDFINEVYAQLEGEAVKPAGTWEEVTAKLDKAFTARSRKQRLLILVAEDFPGLLRRAFSSHGAQAKLRNWLDRAESRVMLVTTSDTGGIDSEPGDPLFGIFHAVSLGEIAMTNAEALFDARFSQGRQVGEERLLRFLFLLTDRTPKAVNVLARTYAQNVKQGLRFVIADYQRYYAGAYEFILADLGQRAANCMHDMIAHGEPVSQSDLARRLGVQQSLIAQPFSEMRRKHLLREESAPSGRAKLASFADRFFVSFYRQTVLGADERHDIVLLLGTILEGPVSDEIREAVDTTANAVHNDSPASAPPMRKEMGSSGEVWPSSSSQGSLNGVRCPTSAKRSRSMMLCPRGSS